MTDDHGTTRTGAGPGSGVIPPPPDPGAPPVPMNLPRIHDRAAQLVRLIGDQMALGASLLLERGATNAGGQPTMSDVQWAALWVRHRTNVRDRVLPALEALADMLDAYADGEGPDETLAEALSESAPTRLDDAIGGAMVR